jgi:hypothetical protein
MKPRVLVGIVFGLVAVAAVTAVGVQTIGSACAALPPDAVENLKETAGYLAVIEAETIECIEASRDSYDRCRMDARLVEVIREREPRLGPGTISLRLYCWPAAGKSDFIPIGAQYVEYGGALPGPLRMWMNRGETGLEASYWE